MDKFSFIGNIEIQVLEELYRSYQADPSSVESSWRDFFKGFDFAKTSYTSSTTDSLTFDKEYKVLQLIDDYRKRGHLFTQTNPVRTRRKYTPTLDLENYGLNDADLGTVFNAGKSIGIGAATLKEIVAHLQNTYCESIGVEYTYIRNLEVVEWLQKKMEAAQNTTNFSRDHKIRFYDKLVRAVGFEQYIHRKFVGQKRFSLEGGDALIPLLDAAITKGANLGIEEYVIGMAHRGRLNVLANILKKDPKNIFGEFMGEKYAEGVALGDVKYHLGYTNEVFTEDCKKVRLNLVPNPSHLETVGPVAEGITRGLIDRNYNGDNSKSATILIHGDAAIAAQGIVYETIQMSQQKAYTTGGTLHIIINNQVGFTTNYLEARSSTYSTDVAKVVQAPVLHVNGDDIEAIIHTVELAMEYRQKFHTDIFIDILCYRKYGHNEGDEPRFTQPTLYKEIASHKNPRDIFGEKLVNTGILTTDILKEKQDKYNIFLDEKLEEAKQLEAVEIVPFLPNFWKDYQHSKPTDFEASPNTGVVKDTLIQIATKINTLPNDKPFFNKLKKLLDERLKSISKNEIDWALGEQLALASLAAEGHRVRISGQDSERGTFSHRHAVYTVENSDDRYYPYQKISPNQAPVDIYNSILSEYAVMAFEYGYSLTSPEGLTVWEAQFGDFHNVAQAMIDQYISSAEDKWGLMSNLALFLPHGYEGQGPEHSSARIERFLTLSANLNMQVAYPTTPANMFHLIRRQTKRSNKLPLVVFTPKSMLRHAKCVSSLDDIAAGCFKEVIDDNNTLPNEVLRVVFCTGKIYYDLLDKKELYNATDLALIRIEQLYPFPESQVKEILNRYPNSIKWIWTQEEPENMGAWTFISQQMKNIVPLEVVARQSSGSPAVGLSKLHFIEQEEIIGKIFRQCTCNLQNKYCGLQCEVGKFKADHKPEHRYFNQTKKQ